MTTSMKESMLFKVKIREKGQQHSISALVCLVQSRPISSSSDTWNLIITIWTACEHPTIIDRSQAK